MEEKKKIGQIIAENLIKLRKENNLTQNDLAMRLNYSDNTISRWERAEITPSIESLEQIAYTFGVPIQALLEENALGVKKETNKKLLMHRLAVVLLCVSIVWFIATTIFVYTDMIFHAHYWQVFVWAIPITCLVMIPFNQFWGKYIYKFVLLSMFQWTLIAAIYLQFIQYNIWLIFMIGIPTQVALCIWAFIKPREK